MAYFTKLTATGQACTGRYRFHGFVLGTDGANDPTVTIEDSDGTANAGEIIPTATFDSTALGLNGMTGLPDDGIFCNYGIRVTIVCAGAVEVTIFYA
jgi:hypothetical protein